MLLPRCAVNPGPSRRLAPQDHRTPRDQAPRCDPGGPGTRRALRRRPRGRCASTAPRPGSAGPGPTGPAGGRLYRASASRTRSRPPLSPTVKAAPCGRGRRDQAGCTTRPPSTPRGSRSCCGTTRPSRPGGHRLPGGLPTGFAIGSAPRHPGRARTPGRGDRRLQAGTHAAVVPADLCRARHRRAQAVATPPTLHRTPRGLRPNACGHSPAWSPTEPPAAEWATRTRQANTPQPQSRTKSSGSANLCNGTFAVILA